MHTASFARKGVALWGPVALTLTLVAGVTLVPASPPTRGDATPFWCLGCGDYALADAVANVVLFLPVGWALARTRMRWLSSLALVLGTTIGIESLQHGFVPGRVASLSDILTNTAGGVAGMALPALRRWIVESGRRALGASIGYGVLLVACLGVAAATEAVPRARMLHWTESADPSRYVRFSGSLSAVRVAGMPVPSHEWRSVPAREVVEVGVDFLSGRPDTGLARVLIGWMPNGSGWVWLEQRGRDLHVHIASASDHLRLHGHSEWLNGIMPAFAGESVTVRLAVRPYSYRIAVATSVRDVVRDASVSPGDGWRLFTPFGATAEPWASLLTGGWMAVLLAPLGYLATVRSRVTAVVIAAGAGTSLILLSIVSGCAWLPLPGWCGATAGFVVGSLGAGRSPPESDPS